MMTSTRPSAPVAGEAPHPRRVFKRRAPVDLPEPLPLLHPLRPIESARVSRELLPHNRVRMTIDHQPLEGVSPDMLLWWFTHIGGDLDYAGKRVSRYRAWHPLDHIAWALDREAPGGGAGEGARFAIREAFQRRSDMLVDSVDTVEKLDRTGIRLVLRVLGVQVFQLEHTWSAGRGRTHYVSVFDLGARSPWLAPVNAYLRRNVFRPHMDDAWLRHNVEEVGRLEFLLPGLVRAEAPQLLA